MDSTQGYASQGSWTSVAFVRSATDVKLYVSGYLSESWPLATLHIDTSLSALNRIVPPLIGASPGNGTAIKSLVGSVDDLMGWSVPLSSTDLSALQYKSFSPSSLPPALVMLYDFDAVRRCDTRGLAPNASGAGPQVLTVEDRVGALPAAATFRHIGWRRFSGRGHLTGRRAADRWRRRLCRRNQRRRQRPADHARDVHVQLRQLPHEQPACARPPCPLWLLRWKDRPGARRWVQRASRPGPRGPGHCRVLCVAQRVAQW